MKMQRCSLTLITVLTIFFLQIFLLSSGETSSDSGGQVNPRIALRDSETLIPSYLGSQTAVSDLEQNRALGLSLASGDFDEDGVPDLVAGYSSSTGGIVTLHRGNVDSIYPNNPGAQQRRKDGTFTDSPFLRPAYAFELPVPAEFIGVGDFNGDKYQDVVAAFSGDEALYLMRGNGKLSLSSAERIPLPGKPTALLVGKMNLDSLEEVVVAVSGQSEPQVLLFEGITGALRSKPEIFSLPAEATSLAVGKLDDDYKTDLAVAADNELIIFHGSDKYEATPARVNRIAFPFRIAGVAIGNFSMDEEYKRELAVLSVDGKLQYLNRTKEDTWQAMKEITTPFTSTKGKSVLIQTKVSTYPADDVLISGGASNQTHIFTSAAHTDLGLEAIAMLPMRLTPHAIKSLVILKSGWSAPSYLKATAAAIFLVTTTLDKGQGSLREAIKQSNASPGLDEIHFQIGTGPQTIAPSKNLPAITDSVLVDATTQPGYVGQPLIELNGDSLAKGIGFKFKDGTSVVTGFGITGYVQGFKIKSFAGTIVEASDINGNETGIQIRKSSTVLIGGPIPFALNNISGNLLNNVEVKKSDSIIIQGNTFQVDSVPDPAHNFTLDRATNFILDNNDVVGSGETGFVTRSSGVNLLGNTFTDNGSVDSSDYAVWRAELSSGIISQGGDYNGNGDVDNADYHFWRSRLFNCGPSPLVLTGLADCIVFDSNSFSQFGKAIVNLTNDPTIVTSNTFQQVGQAIDNGGDGITPAGTVALSAATPTSAQGTLSITPNTDATIELYWTGAPHPSGFGQGEISIATFTGTTDANGILSFTIPYATQPPGSITALGTYDSFTQEFGNAVQISTTGNSPPQFQNLPGAQTFNENDFVSLSFNVLDPDGDTFTVIAVNTPQEVQLIRTGPNDFKLEGTHSFDSAGTYNINLTAADTNNNSAQATIDWTVNNVNQLPDVTNPGDQTNTVGDPISLQIQASDPDGDTLSFFISGQPPGISIGFDNGLISGTLLQEGDYNVSVTVIGSGAPNDETTINFTWTVNAQGASTFTVITTSDFGPGSVRDGINFANSNPDPTTINFNIPLGTPPYVIILQTELPVITSPVNIKGETQPDFTGIPVIRLNGVNLTTVSPGLKISAGSGRVAFLDIQNMTGPGIEIAGTAGNNTIQFNFVTNNEDSGLVINASPGTVILNNSFIFNDGSGVVISNVQDLSTPTVIQGNSMSNNGAEGLLLLNTKNIQVVNNQVIGNSDGGSAINSSNLISSFNTFEANQGAGFGYLNTTDVNVQNDVYKNNNFGSIIFGTSARINFDGTLFINNSSIDIDLGANGPTPNDPMDPDIGANGLQNFPVLTTVTQNFVAVNFNSTPNTVFTLEFFSANSIFATSLGKTTVLTNSSGDAFLTFSYPTQPIGNEILVHATGSEGTSEIFSAPIN